MKTKKSHCCHHEHKCTSTVDPHFVIIKILEKNILIEGLLDLKGKIKKTWKRLRWVQTRMQNQINVRNSRILVFMHKWKDLQQRLKLLSVQKKDNGMLKLINNASQTPAVLEYIARKFVKDAYMVHSIAFMEWRRMHSETTMKDELTELITKLKENLRKKQEKSKSAMEEYIQSAEIDKSIAKKQRSIAVTDAMMNQYFDLTP